MNEIFGNNGCLKKIIPDYEYRTEQYEMANFILERLYDLENGLIEAGTGTGKTLAYLIPSLKYAIDNEKKISLTTETKALQKQLLDKDLPIVKKFFKDYFNTDFSYSLCLGSSNYPCRKRFEAAVLRGKFSKNELRKIEQLKNFFNKTIIFTRFDIKISNQLWNEINREADACNSFRCAFASSCSFQKAKKEWAESDILIMNHYLYFSNIASGKIYLPQTDITIFDEAHSIDTIASSLLGFDLSYNQILEIIDRFYRKSRRNNLISKIGNPSMEKKAKDQIKKITISASNYFEKMRSLFGNNKYHLRIKNPIKFGSEFVAVLKEFMLILSDVEDDFDDEYIKLDFDIARGKLFEFIESLTSFVYMNNDDYVYWMEKNEKEILGDIHLKGQPIDISEIMRKEVITFYESSILVSATLAINNDFSFISSRLGMERHQSLSLKSTFDYKSQMVLYVNNQVSDPNNIKYIDQSARITAEIIKHLGGNCLILFTSYKMLGEVKSLLNDLIDFPIYSQDNMQSSEAVEMYINDNNSVLMGTHSFWQGIDLPGDLLRGVIMMRLPFSVPDLPPVQAKIERLQEKGINPFLALQIPEAIIKFKQGFGRLIRGYNDKGIVAMLDSRIHTKSYGKQFLKAIPECKIVNSIQELKHEYKKISL